MKHTSRIILGVIYLLTFTFGAHAAVHWNGLYHNSTNFDAQTEVVPGTTATNFLNINYEGTNVTYYFLTDSPAGDPGETVGARVRMWSNREYWNEATRVTSVVLQAGVNPFHNTPSAGAVTVDVWETTWQPTRAWSGPVYYSPQILIFTNGSETSDIRYLLRSLETNNTGSAVGTNSDFWVTNPQLIGTNFYDVDYSFQWTNVIPYDLEWIYFNNTNSPAPTVETVPGLGTTTFFEYNYASNEPSYAYVLAPQIGVTGVLMRLYFNAGGGDMYQSAALYTSVVVSAGAPFHGLPLAGSTTANVWRAEFWPPAGWSNDLWYAPQIDKDGDGLMWLVTQANGIAPGAAYTNGFAPPQIFYSEGAGTRDWLYQPTGIIERTGVNMDWAYCGSTNLNPLTEKVPGYGDNTFLDIDYATTMTTFRALTALDRNTVPGETNDVEMRIVFWDTDIQDWSNTWVSMSYIQNVVLDSATPFHGLPAAGTVTVALWETQWRQPLNVSGNPFTNDVAVYYDPLIKSLVGPERFETDRRYLLRQIEGATNGWGPNNYPTNVQYYGRIPEGEHDYRYHNSPYPMDWFYYNNTNSGFGPTEEDVPGLGGVKFLEYSYDSNTPSYIHILVPDTPFKSLDCRFWFNNGGGEVWKNFSFYTNVSIDSASPFHGLPAIGVITLAVWRAEFWAPPNWIDNMWHAPRVTMTNDTTFYFVKTINGDTEGESRINNWTSNPQFFFPTYGYRDWAFYPTAQVQRASRSINLDWAYHCNTNSYNPESETIPGYGGTFRFSDYANTTTLFRILTDTNFALIDDETGSIELRVSWTTNGANWHDSRMTGTVVSTITLNDGDPFHGLPTTGSKNVNVWQVSWQQPTEGGQPITNDVVVWYSPVMRSTMGSQAYQTDDSWLLGRIDGTTNGWGSNNYPSAPQFYGPLFWDAHDYYYVHRWRQADTNYTDGIPNWWWQKYNLELTNKASGDNDNDGCDNWCEWVSDSVPTNPNSFFPAATNVTGYGTFLITIDPTSTARVYDVFWRTNLIPESTAWNPYDYNTTGNSAALNFIVTNELDLKFYRTGVKIP